MSGRGTPTRYTREALSAAATECSDIDEVIAFLGVRPYGKLRRHLFRRFDHFGIDVSHMREPRGRLGVRRPRAEELRRAVAGSVSVAGALRRLGLPESGSGRARFRRWVAEDGVSTAHFLGQAHQRGRPGPTPVRRPEEILVQRDDGHRTRTALLRRALLATGRAERCAECGTGPEWRGRPMTLEIDHINGDWRDDRAENLRLLCPNCHAITSTWCRGGGRHAPGRGHDSAESDAVS
ncbi:HNH endonuclease signature motif containing protein [Streptomyces lycii]|uniref:HNH endonuclease n=1 Tax=Streptomyces lycii TaxID=2654337 RepID=A0ABQ7FRZ2_9ACTN|nr:HNH endonuclease signature motif containing protein [Streptomyces lycii]KAF4410377.1 HNH endonuclease [Streptomyces lycii]